MATATLTSKGQITIPVEVRHDLKVDAGDRVEFIQIAPGRYEFVAANRSVTELKGMFGKAAPCASSTRVRQRMPACRCFADGHEKP